MKTALGIFTAFVSVRANETTTEWKDVPNDGSSNGFLKDEVSGWQQGWGNAGSSGWGWGNRGGQGGCGGGGCGAANTGCGGGGCGNTGGWNNFRNRSCCSMPKVIQNCCCKCNKEKPVEPTKVLADEGECVDKTIKKCRAKNMVGYRMRRVPEQKTQQVYRWVTKNVPKLVTRYKWVYKSENKTDTVRAFKDVTTFETEKQYRFRRSAAQANNNNCGCYKQNCGCQGQAGCGCCQPACQCAPKQTVVRQVRLVKTPKKTSVPYDKEIVSIIKRPQRVPYQHTIQVPKRVREEGTRPYTVYTMRNETVPYVDYEHFDFKVRECRNGDGQFVEELDDTKIVPQQVDEVCQASTRPADLTFTAFNNFASPNTVVLADESDTDLPGFSTDSWQSDPNISDSN